METLTDGVILLEGVFLGFVAGFFYDILRIISGRLTFLRHFLDFLFWIFVTLAIFIWSQGAFDGTVRIYGVIFIAIGLLMYFLTFTKVFLYIGNVIADMIQYFLMLCYLPVTVLIWLEKKIKKFAKNLFLFWRKWYRIEKMTKALDHAIEVTERKQKGGVGSAFDTCRYSNKTSGSNYSDVSCYHATYRGGRNTHHPSKARRDPD